VCSSIAFVVYMMGLKELAATSVAVITVAEVLVAFVLTAAVFGTVLTGWAAVGSSLALLGIGMATSQGRPRVTSP
jgi:drug/metabolite transporter (DMT)-like permease